MFERSIIPALAAILISSPAVGQQHQHDRTDSTTPPQETMRQGMGGMEMMSKMENMSMMENQFMTRAMRFAPQNVAGHAVALGLSDVQRARVREIQSSMSQRAKMADMERAMRVLRESFDADDPDLDAIREAADLLGPMCTGMQGQHLTTAASVRALLTPGQREQLMLLPFSGMSHRMMNR